MLAQLGLGFENALAAGATSQNDSLVPPEETLVKLYGTKHDELMYSARCSIAASRSASQPFGKRRRCICEC